MSPISGACVRALGVNQAHFARLGFRFGMFFESDYVRCMFGSISHPETKLVASEWDLGQGLSSR